MAWSPPHTWTAAETVTAGKMNAVRDNLNHLRDCLLLLEKKAEAPPPDGIVLTVAAGMAAAMELPRPVSRRALFRFWRRDA